MRITVNFYEYIESGEEFNLALSVTVDEETALAFTHRINEPFLETMYLIGAGCLLYVHFCRYCQTNKGFIPTFALMVGLIFAISDVLLLFVDFSLIPKTRIIWIAIFFGTATLYQFVHVIISFKDVSDEESPIITRCKMTYLTLILVLTVITEVSAILNAFLLMQSTPSIERVAISAINIYFWGFIPFFIKGIYEYHLKSLTAPQGDGKVVAISMDGWQNGLPSKSDVFAPSAPTLTTPLTPPIPDRNRAESGVVDWESIRKSSSNIRIQV